MLSITPRNREEGFTLPPVTTSAVRPPSARPTFEKGATRVPAVRAYVEKIFGRPPLENIARGFGLRGHEIRDVSIIPKLFADFAAQGESELWNIQISDQVTAPVIRATIKRGHGNM